MGILLQKSTQLLHILSTISFAQELDYISWCWEASGISIVRSMYSFLNFRGIHLQHPLILWKLPVPSKIKVFM